ncbi:rhomboid-like protein [Mycobacterium botniense]|uniref:Transmembrane protein n=1 Tax=Mycobacterium botniense TaxID=84962 RepID=A0A7I9Y0Y1_9MYCO|nr:rhomboid-like protein [Mycobacterium botniense]GFG75704.1 hypothetical protein MBOT_30690 [Mycobacterium botniense]
MVYRILCGLARVRFTVSYVAALVAVSTALLILGPQVQAQVAQRASTNLHNLAHGNLGTLFGSAFVAEPGPIYIWLPGLACLLALAELLWHSTRLIAAFLVGHIGATLLVAAGLTAAVEFGWLPLSITRATDVGMSYGAVAVLGALTAAIPRRWRPGWVGWWISVGLVGAIVGADFTDAGHTVALILGMLLATRFGRPARWTVTRYGLLTVSVAFGFVVLAHSGWAIVIALAAGALTALAVDRIDRFRVIRMSSVALTAGQSTLGGCASRLTA